MNLNIWLSGVIFSTVSLSIQAQKLQDKPNIVLIQVDQMRPDHLSKMPELMKLANDGIVFEHAYTASPLCQPSRTSIRRRAIYADMCSHIDYYIGKIVETLKVKEYLDNTVILFVSDHGDNLGDYGIWDKRYFYEQSVGVPMIMYGKGIPGRNLRFGSIKSKALVSTLDLYPTILAVAGVDISDLNGPGRNLIEIANGQPSAFRNTVFSELGTCTMIRTAKWKMVYDPEQGGTCYLFNLVSDPQEKNNLAGVSGYENITAELTGQLLSRYITSFQSTQGKEQIRLQKVRVPFNE